MITERRQFSALVVSKSEKTADTLSAVLKSNAFSKVLRADSAGAARRMTLKQPVDVVVINTPLPAISDAIYNAIGTRFYELPITPEQIAMAAAENHK